MTDSASPRIFVQIPSYRDPECQWTVKDLYDKAKHPERIFVGICWQFDPEQDQRCFIQPHPNPENVRVCEYSYKDSLGVGWARAMAQGLVTDEEYTLQIDSHMRFVQDWDVLLLRMLASCPTERSLISSYPPSFIPPNRYSSESVPYLYAPRFNEAGIPMENSITFSTKAAPARPILNYFIAAGFIFAPTTLFHEVPPDPHIYFWGEQIGTAIRAWTRGWDIYSPNINTVYHIYHAHTARSLNWSDNPEWGLKSRKSTARMRFMLRISHDIEEEYNLDSHLLTLGKERDLIEYEQLAALDFKAKRALPHMMEYCIKRIENAGVLLDNKTKEWYQSCFIGNLIVYGDEPSNNHRLVEDFLNTSTVVEHKYAIHLRYAKQFLDHKEHAKAEEWACKAMALAPEKPNALSLLGLVALHRGIPDKALQFLTAANALTKCTVFRAVIPKEPHPCSLLAVCQCKTLNAASAKRYAKLAKDVDPERRDVMQAIIDNPDDPVGKDHWLFPDKEISFNHYQALNVISSDWQEWATSGYRNGVKRETLRLKMRDVGFRTDLVEQFLDKLATQMEPH